MHLNKKSFIIFKYYLFSDIQNIDNSWSLNRIFNCTALFFAILFGYLEIVRELLSQPSMDVNIKKI